MDKIFYKYLLILCCFNFVCFGADNTKNSFEIRTDAFFPSSNRFRKIYGDVGITYGIEASQKLSRTFEGWVNLDWFPKQGRSEGFGDPTKINMINLSFGVKLPYQLSKHFTVYGGIGPCFSEIWLNNRSVCGNEKVSKFGFGGVFKTGLNCFITKHFFLNFYADYIYQPVHFETTINIGGVKTGIGLGCKY